MSLARHGGAHASVVGQLGWVLANIDIKLTPEGGKDLVLPVRSLAVYLHEPDGWTLVQGHFSNAVAS
jgi:hypothetical protein